MRKISILMMLVVLFSLSCIDTRTPDARVALFITMVKSGNFEDARSFVDVDPFSAEVAKKVLALPNDAIIAIVRNSNLPALIKEGVSATDEVKMAEIKKTLEKSMGKDSNYLIDLTLKELSAKVQNKDIDVIGQIANDETGEIYVRFSEASKHPETMIFHIEKKGGEWLISRMHELITGWLF